MAHIQDRRESLGSQSKDTRSVHALSAFDDFTARDFKEQNASYPASPPNIPLRKAGNNIAEEIAFNPAFSNVQKPSNPKPPPRSSSLQHNTSHDDADAALSAFNDFAEERPSTRDRRLRPTSSSTATRGESSVRSHSQDSRAASSHSSINMNHPLPGLQVKSGLDYDALEPLAEDDLDPASFDLVAPVSERSQLYSLEKMSEQLFSVDHLAVILADPVLLQRFTNFLHTYQPEYVPKMVYYLNTLKAIQAIMYANALSVHLQQIDGLDFTKHRPALDRAPELREKARRVFEDLANHSLAAFITQTYVQTVSLTIRRRICGTLPAELREQSDGLAEVFCLTDPSRPDNPIIFASQQFNETTRYGMNHIIGRNCRFLQGPRTNPLSVKRIRDKVNEGKEHVETFLNYRRDGQPFMNLLMIAPLIDSRGVTRYHIGAQVDVSNLVKSRSGLESFARLLQESDDSEHSKTVAPHEERPDMEPEDLNPMVELKGLSEMLTLPELKVVRETGGAMHRVQQEDVQAHEPAANWSNPRVLIQDDATRSRRGSDPTIDTYNPSDNGGRLRGVYSHYLLLRPYPHLRVLFASPSLRMPGMLQSKFMDRIGGSENVKARIEQAFEMGTGGITARVRWGGSRDRRGRPRWIHATPLLGSDGRVGVWMVILTEDEEADS